MVVRTIPITENGRVSQRDAATPLVTYGTTLARRMSADDQRVFFSGQDASKAIGTVHIVLCRSHLPNTVNTEALLDGIAPEIALVALHVADQRIRQLYGVSKEPLDVRAIDEFDAGVMRRTAEQLVDLVRAREPSPQDFTRRPFDLSREEAINAVMVAMATAPITPASLAGGR